MIGWTYHWGKNAPEGCQFAGALSIPRELSLVDGRICNFPVKEALPLLSRESQYVRLVGNQLICSDKAGETVRRDFPDVKSMDILEDTKSCEVFLNEGEMSFSWWLE